jgi:hypothetical protein
VFYLYWIFAWGVKNGGICMHMCLRLCIYVYICVHAHIYLCICIHIYKGETLNAWGSVMGLNLVQDMFLVGITKVYILQYLPAQLMQPQVIYGYTQI